jgi:hypothetical protein
VPLLPNQRVACTSPSRASSSVVMTREVVMPGPGDQRRL